MSNPIVRNRVTVSAEEVLRVATETVTGANVELDANEPPKAPAVTIRWNGQRAFVSASCWLPGWQFKKWCDNLGPHDGGEWFVDGRAPPYLIALLEQLGASSVEVIDAPGYRGTKGFIITDWLPQKK